METKMYTVTFKLAIEAESPEEAKKLFWPTIENKEYDPEALKVTEGLDDRHDDALFDDVINVCDTESIDSQIFTDHPELKETILVNFDYSYSEYNEYLTDFIREQAEKLDIKGYGL